MSAVQQLLPKLSYDQLYTFVWTSESKTLPLGYMLPSVLDSLIHTPRDVRGDISVDHAHKTVSAFALASKEERTNQIAKVTSYWRTHHTFNELRGWRDELWPVYGSSGELLFDIERSASGLFGFNRYGVQLVAFTRDSDEDDEMKVWIGKRSLSTKTYPGLLDNVAAGGIPTGEQPLPSILREAKEEAGFEPSVLSNIEHFGCVSYVYESNTGLICPEAQWLYEVELPKEIIPKPGDNEVEGFLLATTEQIRQWIVEGLFKPNCAIALLRFMLRHNPSLVSRSHELKDAERTISQKLPFPVPEGLESSYYEASDKQHR